MSNRRSGLRTKAGQSVAKICEEKKSSAPPARSSGPYLPALGVYGFGEIEPVILAALVTEDPLLLIGASGTGKTYLLNSLSEALNLEHRHYNASLISFDDLVGFPYPDPEGTGVRFLETPATVWSAESVLIDEISRSKPEQQNRLFSLVHERRVQGIGLPKLRYRWAAMNPCSTDQDSDENYTGSEPLDPALADRFALFVNALDWKDLSDEERRRIAEPVGEGRVADDGGRLKIKIEEWRSEFLGPRRIVPGSGSGLCDDRRDGSEHGGDANVAAALEAACAQPAGGDHRRWRTFEPPVQARPGVQPSSRRVGRAAQDGGGRCGAPGRLGLRGQERGALDPQLHGRARPRQEARDPDQALPGP